MDCRMPGFPVHHQLPELAQIHVHRVSDAIQPSHPLSSPSPPAFNLSQLASFIVISLHEASITFLFKVSGFWCRIKSKFLNVILCLLHLPSKLTSLTFYLYQATGISKHCCPLLYFQIFKHDAPSAWYSISLVFHLAKFQSPSQIPVPFPLRGLAHHLSKWSALPLCFQGTLCLHLFNKAFVTE